MTDSARASSSSNASELPCEGDSAGSTSPTLSAVELLIGMGWILLPAIQYYATAQRTGLQLDGNAALPGLASWDLTPFYALLVVGTLILALARLINTARHKPRVDSGGVNAEPALFGEESAS